MDVRGTRARRIVRALAAGAALTGSAAGCVGPSSRSAELEPGPTDARRAKVRAQHTTWKDYGGGRDQSKYVVLDEIDRSNVHRLQVAWFYPTDDDHRYQFNPIVVDGVMYVLAKNHSLVALDAATGKELWIHANLRGIARRGINYWESEDRTDRRLLFQMNDYLQAIDARTGQSILSFGTNGLVDLKEGLDRDPATVARVQSGTPGKVFENLLLLGTAPGEAYGAAPGHLRAYDVVTGRLVWAFRTIPHPGEYGYETWPPDAYEYVGGANSWGEISVDEERGIAYFPTGSPTYDYYGADRIGANLFANTLLALDARTGKRLWHFQAVHHDLWDYDLAAAPQLVTARHGGKWIDAVAQASKHGFLFAFDRVTGKPLWPIEERPMPASPVPGERAWPTQPFPTVLPAFARQGMTAGDVSPFLLTPEERASRRARLDSLARDGRTGLFTPLSHVHETVALPGAVGGASWGNTAADPERGIVYVISIDWPSFYDRLERHEAAPDGSFGDARPSGSGEALGAVTYTRACQACHGTHRGGSGQAPSLVDVTRRLSYDDFRQVVVSGRGKMPAFSHLDDQALRALYAYLANGASRRWPPEARSPSGPPEGPVVASGGAPGGQELRRAAGSGLGGAPYPEGVSVPSARYNVPGYGLGYAHVIRPPWSSIAAYDLNRGTLKWHRPLGQDLHVAREGGENTGVPRAQRNGMIVTSTGLVFATAKDGKVYAFDADTGRELWRAELPMGTEGLPAMYDVDGRHYLVVTATTPLRWGRGAASDSTATDEPRPQGGYVAFALPY